MKCVSRSKSAAVKDIDIDIADILGKKYRNRIDMDKGDIDPPLLHVNFDFLSFTRFQYCISSIFLHVWCDVEVNYVGECGYLYDTCSDISVLKFISVLVSISFSVNHFYFYIISVLTW